MGPYILLIMMILGIIASASFYGNIHKIAKNTSSKDNVAQRIMQEQAKMQEKIEQLETEIRELHKKDVDSLNGDKHNSLNNK